MLNLWFEDLGLEPDHTCDKQSMHAKNLYVDSGESKNKSPVVSVIPNGIELKDFAEKILTMPSHVNEKIQFLGNFKNSSSNFRIQTFMELLSSGIYFPVVLSDEPQTYEIQKSLFQLYKSSNIILVRNNVNDLEGSISLEDIDNKLHKAGFIAIQKHLCQASDYNKWQDESLNFVRLGQLRRNPAEAEVVLRDAQYVEFHIGSIKKHEFPGNVDASICGLTMDEACQLMRYMGQSRDLKILNITGINPSHLYSEAQTDAIAVLFWYFMEARDARSRMMETRDSKKEYIVSIDYLDRPLHFYKNQMTDQWWLSIWQEGRSEKQLISCSKLDYQLATQNEISPRLMKFLETI